MLSPIIATVKKLLVYKKFIKALQIGKLVRRLTPYATAHLDNLLVIAQEGPEVLQ